MVQNSDEKLPHIFLIVVDTLRSDYSQYLKDKISSMGFKSYENVIAPSPWTIPSHVSLLTGLYSWFHKAHETQKIKIPYIRFNKKDLLMNNILLEYGYRTHLLSANMFISPYFGFKSFDSYRDISIPYYVRGINFLNLKYNKVINKQSEIRYTLIFLRELLKTKSLSLIFRGATSYAIEWLKKPVDKGIDNLIKIIKNDISLEDSSHFFLINLMEIHEPYMRGEKTSVVRNNNRKGHKPPEKYVKIWKNRYPLHVKYLSNKLLQFLKVLQDKGCYDNSFIIITSDHGQLLGEHDSIGHGTYLYDELLRVPLFIKYPEKMQVNVHSDAHDKYISLVNIPHFILDALQNNEARESLLYEDIVFAESYGIPEDIKPTTNEEREHMKNLDKHRIAIYYKGTKSIFNVSEFKFEQVDPEVKDYVRRKVINFLRLGI